MIRAGRGRAALGRAALAGLVAAAVLAPPSVALADAAGPTDFRSEIVGVQPPTGAISLSIEGGDAFVRIVVAPGHEVTVLGYDSEPYLRIERDGTVLENRRSYATYYNRSRYGGTDVPDIVDNAAKPDWKAVGSGGRWAWHDHRAHWMGTDPPVGLQPGTSLPPDVIPLLVDGERVEVEVVTTLMADPPRWPVIAGLAIGAGLAVWAIAARRALAAAVLAAGALAVGAAEYLSLPSETDPLLTWWLLPAMALVAALVAALARPGLLRHAAMALAGLQLAVWAVRRRAALGAAVLPTDLPFWLDRLVTAAALVGAPAVTAVALVLLLRRPAPARPARHPTG